jgi:hypothetical protein
MLHKVKLFYRFYLFKMVRYVLLRPLRPELDGQDVEASRLPAKKRLRRVDQQAI